jgi:trans-aconitate methyltransferase
VERTPWVVSVVDPAPDAVLLEIGCGPGVDAGAVCDRLTTGRLLAIDRSAVAVERALRRNAAHVAAGRLEVRRTSLDALDGPAGSFDAAYAVNVNAFWTGPPAHRAERELGALTGLLRPGGALRLLWAPGGGPAGPARIVPAVMATISAAGFAGVTPVEAAAGFGVLAVRAD